MRRFTRHFPVDDDFFEPLHLSQQHLNDLRTQVRSALNSALAERDDLGATSESNWASWKVEAQLENLSAFSRAENEASTMILSRVCGTMNGNYENIARFFKSETRAEFFNVQKRFFPDVLDAAVLNTCPQRPSVYEAVKWAVYSPSWRRNPIDTCIFEATGVGLSLDHRPYFYRVIIPTTFPDMPDLARTKHTIRIHCKSVMILAPSVLDDSLTEVFGATTTDFKDHHMLRGLYKQYLVGLRNIGTAAHKLPSPTFVLRNDKWVRQDTHRVCFVCSRDFTMLRTKHHCSVCGEAVCRNCLLHNESARYWRANSVASKTCKSCMAGDLDYNLITQEPLTPTVRTRTEPLEREALSERPRSCSDPHGETMPLSRQRHEEWEASSDDLIAATISALSSPSFFSMSPRSRYLDDEIRLDEDTVWLCEGDDRDKEDDDETDGNEDKQSEDNILGRESSLILILCIDTSDMKQEALSRGSSDLRRMSRSTSSVLFHSIGVSIREQKRLLAQLKQVTDSQSIRRNS